jgi:hypothetical protein
MAWVTWVPSGSVMWCRSRPSKHWNSQRIVGRVVGPTQLVVHALLRHCQAHVHLGEPVGVQAQHHNENSTVMRCCFLTKTEEARNSRSARGDRDTT